MTFDRCSGQGSADPCPEPARHRSRRDVQRESRHRDVGRAARAPWHGSEQGLSTACRGPQRPRPRRPASAALGGSACGSGGSARGSGGKSRATLDLGAEVDEQGLERAAAGEARCPGRTLRGAGACLWLRAPRGRTAHDLGFAGRSIPTSAAHGTACPSDRGVGGRGGHGATFAFCSSLSMTEHAEASDRSKQRRADWPHPIGSPWPQSASLAIRVRPSTIETRPSAISRMASGTSRRSRAWTRSARLSGVSSSRTATVSCSRIGPSS